MQGLQPLGIAGETARFTMVRAGRSATGAKAPTSVTLFDQGLVQVLEGAVTGLEPKHPYVLALSDPAGAQIVNALGPIRQVVLGEAEAARRYLVIAPGTPASLGEAVQLQAR